MTTLDYDMVRLFWQFAHERHAMWERRYAGQPAPWTRDPILAVNKFTNAFRVLDRVSQYVVRVVQNPVINNLGPCQEGSNEVIPNFADILFRTTLFRWFNLPMTWEWFRIYFGHYPALDHWDFREYCIAVEELMQRTTAFNSAYIIPPAQVHGYKTKHENVLRTLDMMVEDNFFDIVQDCTTYRDVYALLRRYPLVGPFLGFQFATDYNYTDALHFDENDFVVAGLGAVRGANKILNRGNASTLLIAVFTEHQDDYLERFGLPPIRLFGQRPLHKIDIQNLLCELDKYSRVARPDVGDGSRHHIKFRFDAGTAQQTPLPTVVLPAKWHVRIPERI